MESSNQKMVGDILCEFRGSPETVTGTCEKHGEWSRDTWTKYPDRLKTCPHCAADERQDKANKEAAAKAAAEKQRRLDRLDNAGVSLRHLTRTFDAYIAENAEQSGALEKCRALADGIVKDPVRQPSLIMCGNPGTGKTHLACAIVIEVSDAGRSACRISAADMVREFKDSWRKDSEFDERKLLNWYGNIDLLVIEEVGVQFGSDTERMYIFEVVNRRYENCLPTVIVSNMDIEKIRAEVGERVLDRLREDGGRMIKFTGESWRKQ